MNIALKNKEKIFLFTQKHPGQKTTDIAKEFGVSRVSVYSHFETLIGEGRVERRGRARATRYFPIPQILYGADIIPDIEKLLLDKYDEAVSREEILRTFDSYMMYVDADGMTSYGFDAFVLWCHDSRHDFSHSIPEKAVEYIDLVGSIEYLRGKNGFLDVTIPARAILKGDMEYGFDSFLISAVSVLSHGFGSTRTALSLRYGKKNSNSELLRDAITPSIEPIRQYIQKQKVDALIFAPPTEGRKVQFREILEEELTLSLPKISAEKLPLSGRVLEPQKNIRDKKLRIHNAMGSMIVTIPQNLHHYTHILILDDSFTTGATPNAIALKLRKAGYTEKITIITICGSFDYDLAISEDEI